MALVGLILGALLGYAIPAMNANSIYDVGTSVRAPGESPQAGVRIFLAVVLGFVGAVVGTVLSTTLS